MSEQVVEPRKSRIKKRISRVFFNKSIDIPKYESVTIDVEFDEEIEWSDLEERNRKSGNITKLLKTEFNKTVQDVLSKLFYKKDVNPVEKELSDELGDSINQSLQDHGLDD